MEKFLPELRKSASKRHIVHLMVGTYTLQNLAWTILHKTSLYRNIRNILLADNEQSQKKR